MPQVRELKTLKGGSFSNTTIVDDNGNLKVRKTTSRKTDREFGFFRWVSQYRKMRQYSEIFPGLVPKPTQFENIGDASSFFIKYFAGYQNGYEYLTSCEQSGQVDNFCKNLIATIEKVCQNTGTASFEQFEIYWLEEVVDRVRLMHTYIDDLGIDGPFFLDGVEVPIISITDVFEKIKIFRDIRFVECYSHGNLTLENVLVSPDGQDIIYIDLYEENYLDTIENELSQVLQSSQYDYELICSLPVSGDETRYSVDRNPHKNISLFQQKFSKYIDRKFSEDHRNLIKFYCASQFFRMAPFKIKRSPRHAMYFYLLANKILADL